MVISIFHHVNNMELHESVLGETFSLGSLHNKWSGFRIKLSQVDVTSYLKPDFTKSESHFVSCAYSTLLQC